MESEKKSKRKLSFLRDIALYLLFFIALFAVANLVCCIPSYAAFDEIDSFSALTAEVDTELDSDGFWKVTNKTEDSFRILQVTDAHLVCSPFSRKADLATINMIRDAAEASLPHLVVLTGDALYPALWSGGINNMLQAKAIAALFSQLEIPYAFIFGNHDADFWGMASKNQISKFFEEQPYSLFRTGDSSLEGQGNYIVKLYNMDDTLNSLLFMLDTNSSSAMRYKGVQAKQVEWYKNTVAAYGGNSLLSFVFVHIPLPEYQDAWDTRRTSESQFLFGVGKVAIKSGDSSSLLFDAILESKSTKAVLCGHDHQNNWTIRYKGIQLSYGLPSTHTLYASGYHEQLGAQLLVVSEYGDFIIRHMHESKNFSTMAKCCA